jgi:endonuclease/exonuclease/phosphatase (EEP) superfamily protein YafD
VGDLPLTELVQIDHVLARGLTVTGAGSEVIPGTDHAMVWASWR